MGNGLMTRRRPLQHLLEEAGGREDQKTKVPGRKSDDLPSREYMKILTKDEPRKKVEEALKKKQMSLKEFNNCHADLLDMCPDEICHRVHDFR